jgi:hypothetical protein
MATEWLTYCDEGPKLHMPLGMERFFNEGLWCNAGLWRYDREWLAEMRRGVHARIGMRV